MSSICHSRVFGTSREIGRLEGGGGSSQDGGKGPVECATNRYGRGNGPPYPVYSTPRGRRGGPSFQLSRKTIKGFPVVS